MPSNPTTRPIHRPGLPNHPVHGVRQPACRRLPNLRRARRVTFLMQQKRSPSRTSIYQRGQTTTELPACLATPDTESAHATQLRSRPHVLAKAPARRRLENTAS
jgi:hypothetical protein